MTQTESIAQLPQPDNSPDRDSLTLQEIADLCGVTYKYARQYGDQPAVKQFMGAFSVPGRQGARYPLHSEHKWRMLIDAAQKKLLTPGTVQAWLANLEINPIHALAHLPQPGENALTLNPIHALAQLPQMGEQALSIGEEAVALLRQLVMQMPPPDDCLLDAEGAAALLCCKPRTVRRYVRPVRRGRWRRTDILRHIQNL